MTPLFNLGHEDSGYEVTHELIAVTNTTVVNTETMCEVLRKIAAAGLTGPITPVLDVTRYQHNVAVKALPARWGIALLFLPSYSPNRNLIERLWKFIKRRALDGLPTRHAEPLKTLTTLDSNIFKHVYVVYA